MTINKAQGQSLVKFGVFLPEDVFTHGQLYVALSRATDQRNVKILGSKEHIINGHQYAKNVVYKTILLP
jgi:ATP-dependent exoDNAse (exonuclease V) alpha subunit